MAEEEMAFIGREGETLVVASGHRGPVNEAALARLRERFPVERYRIATNGPMAVIWDTYPEGFDAFPMIGPDGGTYMYSPDRKAFVGAQPHA